MAGPGSLLCVVLGLVFGVNTGKALLNLINSPDRHIASGKPFLVICHSEIEQPIVGCQFKVWHVLQKSEGELLDGTNPQSVVTKSNPNRPDTWYTASFDNDVSKGKCRVKLQGLEGEQLLVGCKLTTLAGQSAVKTVAIYQRETIQLQNNIIRQQFMVAPGENVDILVRSTSELTSCRSTLANGEEVQVWPGGYQWSYNVVYPANSRYKPFGASGLVQGECGFTINNVQDCDNGVFLVRAEQWNGISSITAAVTIVLIVSKATTPILTLTPKEYDINELVTATCSVRGRQPVIVWTLGGGPLDNSKWTESVGTEWSWPWQEDDVSQSFTGKMQKTDDGKELGCQVVDARSNIGHSSVVTLRLKTNTSDSTNLETTMSPEHVQTQPGNEMTILCLSKKSGTITDCQYKLWYVSEQTERSVLEGRNGNPYHLGSSFTANYTKDFTSGRCYVTLRGTRGSKLLVGCKLTTSNIAAVKTIAIFQTATPKLVLQESSELVVARPGDNVDILVKSSRAISKCSSTLPSGVEVEIVPSSWGNTLTSTNLRYKAIGGKLYDGECSFTINNVQQRDNGVFFVVAEGFSGERGAKAVTLIVQSMSSPLLALDATEFVAGHNATATCSVRGILQPSDVNFIWTLGGVALGKKPASVSAAWSWPWQETNFSQSFIWTLASEHNGTNLTCQVYTQDVVSNTISIYLISLMPEDESHGKTRPAGTDVVNSSVLPAEGKAEDSSTDIRRTGREVIIGVAVLVASVVIICLVVVPVVLKRRGCCKGQPVTIEKSPEDSVAWNRHRQSRDVGASDADADDEEVVLYENVAKNQISTGETIENLNVQPTVGTTPPRQPERSNVKPTACSTPQNSAGIPKVQAKVGSGPSTPTESPGVPKKKGRTPTQTQTAVHSDLGDEAEVSYAELRGHDSMLGRSTLPPQPEEVTYTDLDWRQ